jgi:hypothetical protein
VLPSDATSVLSVGVDTSSIFAEEAMAAAGDVGPVAVVRDTSAEKDRPPAGGAGMGRVWRRDKVGARWICMADVGAAGLLVPGAGVSGTTE